MNISTASEDSVSPADTGQEHPSFFPANHRLAFALVTTLFFIWGMSNNLTDILVQQFKKSFTLSPLEAQLVQTSVFFGYFCMALPAALLMQKRGYKTGIVVGLCLFGTGTLMFWPAAVIAQYWLMLTALFFVGCGSAILETAANPFIAQFGSAATAERRLNFSQAFNPPGTITGVLIGTFFIFSGVELSAARVAEMQAAGTYIPYLHSEIMRVVPTYVTLGCVVLLLALLIGRTSFPRIADESGAIASGGLVSQISQLLSRPSLRAAILAQFCYCGAQVCTWSAFIPYMKQYTLSTERAAAYLLTGNLIAFAVGRFASTALMRWFSATSMIGVYAVINIGLVGLAIVSPGSVGAGALVASSFFMSIMFPTIFALGVKGLGAQTKLGGSLIVMSVVGAAVFPPILGFIATRTGSYARGYIVVAFCYAVVAIYGFSARGRVTIAGTPLAT